MRQAGILAAAGLYALEHHRDRLADDHANARLIGERLAARPAWARPRARARRNIVVFHLRRRARRAPRWSSVRRERGVLVMAFGPRTVRAVTHLDVDRDDCAAAADVLAAAAAAA